MHQPRHSTLLALALLLLAAPAALAQTEAPRQEDTYVTQKMFQNRVFDVKNRDPQSLVRVLAPLTSGFRGAVVSANPEFRTISVRDFPENIAVIEEAIRRLDTPEAARPARPSVEFRVYMLVASNEETLANRYPAELAEVVKQLQSALGYKNFNLMGSQIVRGKEGRGDNYNKGVADLRLTNDTPASKNPVSLREGERVVAGTTSIADKSVVVVLSASMTK